MYKIIVTGPECSGKTTLIKKLSQHFKISFAKEYAREYLEKNGLVYEQNDLLKIAQKQIEKEKKFNLLDTDLLTIKIWSEYKYGNCNDWILEKIRNQISQKRIYILCKPDIKWQYDTDYGCAFGKYMKDGYVNGTESTPYFNLRLVDDEDDES